MIFYQKRKVYLKFMQAFSPIFPYKVMLKMTFPIWRLKPSYLHIVDETVVQKYFINQ